jgi:single-strand DNA-binding protein
MIQLTIIGNIGQDAKVIAVNDRKSIQFHVAVNKSYKDQNGQKVEHTIWVSCSYWKNDDKGTKIADYLKAGTKVLIQGEPAAKHYQSKDGTHNASLNLNVNYLEFVGGAQKTDETKNGGQPANNSPASQPGNQQIPEIMPNPNFDNFQSNSGDDDLPF